MNFAKAAFTLLCVLLLTVLTRITRLPNSEDKLLEPTEATIAANLKLPKGYRLRNRDDKELLSKKAMPLGDRDWGRKGEVNLVAFPRELVNQLLTPGVVLRLVNRTQENAVFVSCDLYLPIVQEAMDVEGNWRPVEGLPTSWCGNSYGSIPLQPDRYWEFKAKRFSGAFVTKLRFRLKRTDQPAIYSNVFEGSVDIDNFKEEGAMDFCTLGRP